MLLYPLKVTILSGGQTCAVTGNIMVATLSGWTPCFNTDSNVMISDYIEGVNCGSIGLYRTVEIDKSILFKESRESQS